MANTAVQSIKKGIAATAAARSKHRAVSRVSGRVQDAISIAAGKGLLEGGRTVMVRGRMPAALVSQAKRMTRITSDSKLLEAALAYIVAADDYGDWLISQRGSINPELDLEF